VCGCDAGALGAERSLSALSPPHFGDADTVDAKRLRFKIIGIETLR
jgi:hypothetical protein